MADKKETRYEGYRSIEFDWPAEGVLRLTFCKPEKMNALDSKGHEELADVWREIDTDPEVSAVIIRGSGRAFSAGGDFEMLKGMMDDFTIRARVWRESRDLVYNMINCSKPIVSAIHGPAVGAGLVAALLADISIASKSARIVDGHTKLGVVPGDHAAIIWPLLCGMAKAKYYLMLCEPINGGQAESMGLVSLSVEEEALQETALDVATKLASGAPSALRWTKYALNNWLRQAGPIFDTSLALEFMGFSSPEAQEGLSALLEKRPANFDKNSPI